MSFWPLFAVKSEKMILDPSGGEPGAKATEGRPTD
jgi:hypothetical protein